MNNIDKSSSSYKYSNGYRLDMNKLELENRAWKGLRIVNKKPFYVKDKEKGKVEIYLELGTHIGKYWLFALEEQRRYLDQYDGNTTVHPCYGSYVLFTNDLTTLVRFIQKKYNLDPIFPTDFLKETNHERSEMARDEIKGLSWRFPEIRKRVYGER